MRRKYFLSVIFLSGILLIGSCAIITDDESRRFVSILRNIKHVGGSRNISYYHKYLKYKTKYLQIKNSISK